MKQHQFRQINQSKSQVFWLVFFILIFLLIAGFYVGLRFGAISYSHKELINTLQHPLKENAIQNIIIDLRLPRTIAACLVGAAFACSGAIMQGVTRNSIADPGLLGINAGAGLALVIAFIFSSSLHYSLILLIGLLGASCAAVVVFVLAYRPQQGFEPIRLILSGAMIATLLSAIGQGLTLYFQLSTAFIGWQAGGLMGVNWRMITIITPFILVGLGLAQMFSRQLTILSLNEQVAQGLGQKTKKMTLLFLGIVLLLSAAAVALVGSIALVGLIIPHFAKALSGKYYQKILPLSSLAGAVFMLWCDSFSRMIKPPLETPLSSIVSFFSFPIFIYLIRKGSLYEQ